ncbi:MAG: hypothetical protein HFJ44_02105 [Clostridia bacterium]|mgnify:CR=1 FL=1|jgi:hypothetical protein|nr:hypothetical protein [Clostridia bacterium]
MKIKKNEILFFVGLYVLLFRMLCNATTYIELSSLSQKVLLIIGVFCLVFKIVIDTKQMSKLLKYLIILTLLFLNYQICSESIIFTTFLIIIASKNIELKKIIKSLCITLSSLLLFSILMYIVAYIFDAELLHYNIRKVENTIQVRHTFFFAHANTFSNILCWTYFMYLYYNYEKIGAIDKIVLCMIAVFIYVFPNSRTTAIIMVLFLFVLWGYKKIKDTKVVTFLVKNIWIICMIISIGCLIFHNSGLVQKVDTMLSGRINLGYQVYNLYGTTLLGQYVPVGCSIQISATRWIMSLVIDNLYYRLLFYYGIIISIFFTYMIQKTLAKQVKEKNEKNVVFLVLLCLFGLMETMSLQALVAFPLLLMRDEL